MAKKKHRFRKIFKKYGTIGGGVLIALWFLGKFIWSLFADRVINYVNTWLDETIFYSCWQDIVNTIDQVKTLKFDPSLVILIIGFSFILVTQIILRFPDLYSFFTKKPKMSGITLSDNFCVLFLENDIQEYKFTLCNWSGQTIKDAYIILDEHACKKKEEDEWKVVHSNFIDRPFEWKRYNISKDGKINIEYKERAAFSLGRFYYGEILNKPTSNFFLSLFGKREGSNVEVEMNKIHRLLIAFRGKSQRGDILPDICWYIKFEAVPKRKNKAGGLANVVIKRIKENVQPQE